MERIVPDSLAADSDSDSVIATQDSAVYLLTEAMGYTFSAALRAAAILGVADHLVDGPRTPGELASPTNSNADFLYRILRLLATRDVFREDGNGRFHLTPRAEALRTDVPSSARRGIIMSTMRTHWLTAFELATAVRTGRQVCETVFGAPFFDHLAQDPDGGAEFHNGMESFSDAARQFALRAYEFPEFGTVVDVGGGHGGFLADVLRRNPGLRGVLFDQEHVLANHCLGQLTDDRWDLAAGDFFAAAPTGGDLYTLMYILHDWSDAECVRILRNCRRAMGPDARIAVFDSVVPVGNDPDYAKVLDIIMLMMLTGRERTATEFEQLFAEAGLELTRIVPTRGPLSVIEAVARRI
ncbi:COMT family class I SAM-dependent methyltransferase [Amycolatopsis sp. NBC_00345]|uniref:methyltransferase n=1 Tax=Amycolatopsis sp. NBC_00345 TaxID=2975955 RepID=UPI002E25A71C